MPSERAMDRSMNIRIVKRLVKLTSFFGVVFFLFFSITWQNVRVYSMNRKIEELTRLRNELEKSMYLQNMELSYLKSRERIKKIASEELGMIPVTYRDVKIIVY